MQQDVVVSDLMTTAEACALVRRSRKSFWLLRKQPGFPRPVRHHPKAHPLWPRAALLAWLAAQQAANAEGGV